MSSSTIADFVKERALDRIGILSSLEAWAIETVTKALEADTEKLIFAEMRKQALSGAPEKVIIARCYFRNISDSSIEPYHHAVDKISVQMSKDLMRLCCNHTVNRRIMGCGPFKVSAGTDGASIEFRMHHDVRDVNGYGAADFIEVWLCLDKE